ncbi:MAG: tetratricopeptide repeat protein [Deltaproteobacteria bacterium]|nr:MAG: tetratricopeptide repeat protein [Deltaproteobacteria bacterium]
MAKSMADKYRLILKADPGSMVFVELAKALIDAGEYEEAVEVVARGCDHHPDSIVGQVLWGRALIALGRPDEAMDHFDAAIEIDPDNPYAYNLIGEVLLSHQLYRSALPILRRAVSLQPGDRRVRQWLERAEAAVAEDGAEATPAKVATDPTIATEAYRRGEAAGSEDEAAVFESAFDRIAAASSTPEPDGSEMPTEVSVAALGTADVSTTPDRPRAVAPAPEHPSAALDGADLPELAPHAADTAATDPGTDPFDETVETPLPPPTAGGREAESAGDPVPDDPFAQVGGGAPVDDEVLPGMTRTFEQLAEEAESGELPDAPWDEAGEPASDEGARSPRIVPGGPGLNDPTLFSPPPPAPPPLPPRGMPQRASEAPRQATRVLGLELPPEEEAAPAEEQALPKVMVEPPGDATAQRLALEYEAELRAKIMPGEGPPAGFLQRHGRWVLIGGFAALALLVAAVATVFALRASRETRIQNGLKAAQNGIARDSYAGYTQALETLAEVLDLDPENTLARALTAEAQAILYARFDAKPERKKAALEILADPKVVTSHPDLALDARYHLATGAEREKVGEEVLAALKARPDSATLHYLAGRHALATGHPKEATKHFEKALQLAPGHVRTVVELGEQLARKGRYAEALTYFDNARQNFPGHVRAQLGAAEAKLELGRDLEGALGIVDVLEKDDKTPLAPEERARLALVGARLLAALGKPEAAIARLVAARRTFPARPDLALALARLYHQRFDLDRALAVVESALKAHPGDEALERLEAEILIDGSRYEEALERLAGAEQSPEIARLRGIAAYFAGRLAQARKAFDATRNAEGKMPLPAAVYLALAELGGGSEQKARAVLDRAAKALPADPLVGWALGRWLLETGAHTAAVRQLRKVVTRHPEHFRALYDLARAELEKGWTDKAMEHVARAVEVNPSFREGQTLLGEIHLRLGEWEPAAAAFEAALRHAPKDARAHRGLAEAKLGQGDLEAALDHAEAARRADPRDGRNHHIVGRVQLARGKAAQASRALLRARRLLPDDPAVLTDLGRAYLLRGRGGARSAKKSFEQALELDRRRGEALLGLGEAQLLLGEKEAAATFRKAAAALKKARRAPERAQALLGLARALRAEGESSLRRAQNAAWDAVKAFDSAEARELLAAILIESGKPAMARTHLEKAAELAPDRASVKFYLGLAWAEDDPDVAKAHLRAYLEAEPRGAHAREARRLLRSL